MAPGLLTVKQVTEEYNNVKPRQVLYAIRSGRIPASKCGWQWLVNRKDLPKIFPIREYNKRNEG